MESDEDFRRVEAAIDAALRIATSTTAGRLVLERVANGLDPDLFSPRGRARLEELLDRAAPGPPPLEPRELRGALREAWGGDELDELEDEPAAVTPTSQVHRGVHEGRPVAVKVLRPEIAGRLRQDLALLEALAAPLGAAFPALDAGAVMREVRERVMDEFDLEHEAGTQRRFHRALRRHPYLSVPAPVSALASEEVLVSEWVDGVPLLDAPEPEAAAARLLVFGLGAARHGVIHADLDPNDILVRPDGSLAILDFGAVAELPPERHALLVEAVDAFAAGDPEQLDAALAALEVLPPGHGETLLELGRHVLGELGEEAPSRLDAQALRRAGRRAAERPQALSTLMRSGRMPPRDVWVGRGTVQLFGTIARLGTTAPWLALVQAGLREGWEADPELA